MGLVRARVASAGSGSWNMPSRHETGELHTRPQRLRCASNGPTKKYLTRLVVGALVVRIHEPAALVNPCPESFRFSRPFGLRGFGLRHKHGDTILDYRDLGIPHTTFILVGVDRHDVFSMHESFFALRFVSSH